MIINKPVFLEYLKKYSSGEHPLNRARLCTTLNIPDRQLRELISELQSEGAPIFAASPGGYFYVHNTRVDIEAAAKYLSSEHKRTNTLRNKLRVAYHNFKKNFPLNRVACLEDQQEMF